MDMTDKEKLVQAYNLLNGIPVVGVKQMEALLVAMRRIEEVVNGAEEVKEEI